jgi:hypothetical protein
MSQSVRAAASNIAAVLRKSASTNTAGYQPTTDHDSDDDSEETQIVHSEVKKQGIIPQVVEAHPPCARRIP